MYTQQERRTPTQTLFRKCSPLLQHLRLLFFSAAFLWCGAGMAQEASPPASTQPVPSALSDNVMQTTLGLLFVLGLLFALVWLLKRMGIGNQKRHRGFYKVLATSALGPREKIVLIEVGDTWLVLGMTSSSINTLHSMPAGSIELNEAFNPAVNFAKMLERVKTGKIKSQ